MILDTNAISAFADDVPSAVAMIGGAEQISIPVIVLGEFAYGIAQSSKRKYYEIWLEQLLTGCHVLDITWNTAKSYARIRSELRQHGKPIPANDVWIAALSREHNVSVMSRDAHFDHVKGLRRVGW